MSDQNTSLPVRTEANGDVAVKIVDGTVTSQALNIDASGKVISKLNDGSGNVITSQVNGAQRALDVGVNVAGVQVDPRAIRTLVFATDKVDTSGSVVALDAGTLAALESITVQNGAGASAVNIQDGGNSITVDAVALDIRHLMAATDVVSANIRDNTGAAFSATNPLPVTISADGAGTEVNDYATNPAVAVLSTGVHTYTVTAGKTFLLTQVEASASGKMKIEIAVETGVATNTFNTKFVQFNSAATTNTSIILQSPISVAAGVRVRATITNRDTAAQDLYSTICGQEV